MTVLVVGDAIFDVWHRYRVTRPSPEDPAVPVVTLAGEPTIELGGALNVVRGLCAPLNGRPRADTAYLDTHVRSFSERAWLNRALDHLSAAYLSRAPGDRPPIPVTEKRRVQVAGATVFREDHDSLEPPARYWPGELAEQVAWVTRAPRAHERAVVVVDYAKGALPPALVAEVLTLIEPGLVVLDLKPELLLRALTSAEAGPVALRGALGRVRQVVVKLNAGEATTVAEARRFPGAGEPTTLENVSVEVARTLRGTLVVTRGALGAVITPGRATQVVVTPAGPRATPRSVVGAGDVFTATLTRALLDGAQVRDAVTRAVQVATQACLTQTATLTPS